MKFYPYPITGGIRFKLPLVSIICILSFWIGDLHAETMRVSYASLTGNTQAITYVADRAGIFQKYGLNVEMTLITGGPISIGALLNGDVAMDLRAPIAALQAMAHGSQLTFLLSQSNILDYDVVARPEISDVRQLKGKRVGVIRLGGISELMVRYLFGKLGFNVDKDIAILQVGQSRLTAMERGAIDATVFSPIETYSAKRLGFKVIDMPSLPFFGSTIITTRNFVAKHPDTVTKFLQGYLEGMRFFLQEKRKSMDYLSDLLRIQDPQILELAYSTNPVHRLGRKPYPTAEAVANTLEIMGSRDPKVQKLKTQQLFDLKFLSDLDRSGFIDNLYLSK